MNTLAERITLARIEQGFNKSQFAKKVGVSGPTVTDWESGKIQELKGDNLIKASSTLTVNPKWLATGKGPKKPPIGITENITTGDSVDFEIRRDSKVHFGSGKSTTKITMNIDPVAFETGRVPLISWIQAGTFQSVEDFFEPGDADEWPMCPVSHGKHAFCLVVRGPSMEPEYHSGDWIFVDPDRQAENGSHVVIRLDDYDEATFKKLVIEGNEKYLEALNPNWPEKIIRINSNATIVGVVIFSGRPR